MISQEGGGGTFLGINPVRSENSVFTYAEANLKYILNGLLAPLPTP